MYFPFDQFFDSYKVLLVFLVNERDRLTCLVGPGGATIEEWNAAARREGLGKRSASLYDFRKALKDKQRVHTTGDRWYVTKL